MTILFVRGGNRGIDPITQNQGFSLINKGYDVHFFDILGKGALGYLSNVKILREQSKLLKPDIIHCHYSLSGIVAAIAMQKTPIVISFMGTDVNAASLFQKMIINFLIRFTWKEVIVKSKKMKSNLGCNKAHVIPNGVDFKNYRPIEKYEALCKLGWDSSKKHILFSSNPERPEKNYHLAESAIKILNDKNIEVHFLMNLSQTEMPYYYNAADCLLLTSLYEGSPNVIKEAMACNCPIVSTDVGDVRELIENIKGCFISMFEAKDLALKINEALNFNQRTKGSEAIKHLDSRIIADKLIAIYKKARN
jgi:glycosyltransferase involved in cell wall biosynthesis